MIKIQDMSFGYSSAKRIFTGFDLELGGGMVCGLLGKNGVGKSTLLHLAAGLLRPTAGSVTYRGTATFARRPEMLSDVFLVPEEFALPAIKLESWLKVVTPFYPRFDAERMSSCLGLFEVPRDSNLGSLSMGQRKKAFLSFALASGATTLLMDEPTNGLDIPSKSQFRKVLSQFMDDDKCVIISTHQVGDVENLLDHVVILDGNSVLLNCPLADVSRRLSFVIGDSAPADAYYSQPSVGGVAAVVPATEGNETDVNLELLFNAMMSSAAARDLFNKEVI